MTSKAYPDDASPQECLEYLKMCLKSHQDGVRIIGNLRICDAVRSIEALEARLKAAEAVCRAALELRNSGHDGPFIGDVCVPLFSALADLESAKFKNGDAQLDGRPTTPGEGRTSIRLTPGVIASYDAHRFMDRFLVGEIVSDMIAKIQGQLPGFSYLVDLDRDYESGEESLLLVAETGDDDFALICRVAQDDNRRLAHRNILCHIVQA